MTFADDILPSLAACRAIPGTLGMRPHRVYLLTGTWSGERAGSGVESESGRELTESGQPPRVTWLDSEALALGGFPAGSVEIGNLTPSHVGGGVSFSDLIGRSLAEGQVMFVRIEGPRHPQGARYRITEARHKSAVSYSIVCAPEM